jgi:hypothetical protein
MLQPLMLVEYEAPDNIPLAAVEIADLPEDWISREVDTQQIGGKWLNSASQTLLTVPSAIVPVSRAPERNPTTLDYSLNANAPRLPERRPVLSQSSARKDHQLTGSHTPRSLPGTEERHPLSILLRSRSRRPEQRSKRTLLA